MRKPPDGYEKWEDVPWVKDRAEIKRKLREMEFFLTFDVIEFLDSVLKNDRMALTALWKAQDGLRELESRIHEGLIVPRD